MDFSNLVNFGILVVSMMLPYTAILSCTRMISHQNRLPAKQKAFLRIHPVLAGLKYWVGCLLNINDIRESYSQRCRCVLARWKNFSELVGNCVWGSDRCSAIGQEQWGSEQSSVLTLVLVNTSWSPLPWFLQKKRKEREENEGAEKGQKSGLEKLTCSSSLLGCHTDNVHCKESWETHAKNL